MESNVVNKTRGGERRRRMTSFPVTRHRFHISIKFECYFNFLYFKIRVEWIIEIRLTWPGWFNIKYSKTQIREKFKEILLQSFVHVETC